MEGRLASHKSPAEIHNFRRNAIFTCNNAIMVCGSPINGCPHTQTPTVPDDVSHKPHTCIVLRATNLEQTWSEWILWAGYKRWRHEKVNVWRPTWIKVFLAGRMLVFFSVVLVVAVVEVATGTGFAHVNEPLALKYIDHSCHAENITGFYLKVRNANEAVRMYPNWNPYGKSWLMAVARLL